jgi:hypothetical protein
MSQSTSLRSLTPLSVNPKPEMSPLGHVRMSNTGIHILYDQLAAYIPYHVPLRGPTCHAYVPTFLTHMLLYPSQLTRMCP